MSLLTGQIPSITYDTYRQGHGGSVTFRPAVIGTLHDVCAGHIPRGKIKKRCREYIGVTIYLMRATRGAMPHINKL